MRERDIVEKVYEILRLKNIADQKLQYITEDELIDSTIYEIKALEKRYEYYIRICKEKGISANGLLAK